MLPASARAPAVVGTGPPSHPLTGKPPKSGTLALNLARKSAWFRAHSKMKQGGMISRNSRRERYDATKATMEYLLFKILFLYGLYASPSHSASI